MTSDPLRHLGPGERDCVLRYLSYVGVALGDKLESIWLFGSFARGDMWPPHMPMNSDIDLLIVTTADLNSSEQRALLNDTYPLYLEYGRQISPQFWSASKFDNPITDAAISFKARLLNEGRLVFSCNPLSCRED